MENQSKDFPVQRQIAAVPPESIADSNAAPPRRDFSGNAPRRPRIGAAGVCGFAAFALLAQMDAARAQGTKPATPLKPNTPATTTVPKPPAPGTPAGQTPVAPKADGDDYSGKTLPSDFIPPRKAPEVLTLEKPLTTWAEQRDTSRKLTKDKFSNALRAGELTSTTRPVLVDGAKWSIHRLSVDPSKEKADKDRLIEEAIAAKKEVPRELKEPLIREQLAELRDRLVRDVNGAGKLAENPQAGRNFREFYFKEIVARAAELLDGNYHVRLNAVILLGELTISEGDPRKNIPDEAYTDAAYPLLKVIEDRTQPDSVKIAAVRGIHRILQLGKPNPELKLRISQSLVAELKRPEMHWWYQMRLAEALGQADAVLDLNRVPIVAQTLMETLLDRNRHCVVRSEAARSLGRIPLDGNVNAGLIAFEVAHLAQELASEFNKKPNGAFWKDCYFKIYLAFRPFDAAGEKRGDGLLTKVQKAAQSKHKAMVDEAYKQSLSLVNHVYPDRNNAPIPDTLLTPVTDWLKKNQPTDDRLAPNLPPLRTATPVVETKPPAG